MLEVRARGLQELHPLGAPFRLATGDGGLEGLEHAQGQQASQGVAIARSEGGDDHFIGAARPLKKGRRLEGRVAGAERGQGLHGGFRRVNLLGATSRRFHGGTARFLGGRVLRLPTHAPAQHRVELEQHHGGQGGEKDE